MVLSAPPGPSLPKTETGHPSEQSEVAIDVDGKEAPSETFVDVDGDGPLAVDEQPQEADCRICLLMDKIERMVSPCACDGSLKYAHYSCLEQWSIEARSLTCEICTEIYRQPYKNRLTSALANAESQERGTLASTSPPDTSAVQWRFEPGLSLPAKRLWCRLIFITALTVALIYIVLFLYKGYQFSFWTVTVLRIVSFILPFYLIGKAAIALRRYRQERA